MENQEKPHKRRVRYSGTHPKRFSEKYKEHQPEKYADVVEKVIRKGRLRRYAYFYLCEGNSGFSSDTAGTARPGRYPGIWRAYSGDAEMSERRGHIYGLDVDPIESKKQKRD